MVRVCAIQNAVYSGKNIPSTKEYALTAVECNRLQFEMKENWCWNVYNVYNSQFQED